MRVYKLWLMAIFLAAVFMAGCGIVNGGPSDTLVPTVTFTDVTNGDTGVATNKKIAVTFSKVMDHSTINTITFTVTGPGGTPVLGTVTNVGLIATFNPTSDLAADTTYEVTLTTGAKDLAKNALAVDKTWRFTTGAAPDTTAPTVTFSNPANGDAGVAINKKIAATFSKGMDPLTITTATFILTGPGATAVSGAVTYVGLIATFTPTSNLVANTTYTATILTVVKDLAGNALAVDKTWSFTTGAAADTTPPTVTLIDPANGNTGVATNKKIAVAFSEVMDPLTINTTTFTVKQGTTPVSGIVTNVGLISTFTPDSNLVANTTYTAKIVTNVKDLAGNALAVDKTWSFTTGAAADTTPPTITLIDPADGNTGVATNKKIAVAFSEVMDPLTINITTFTVKQGTTPVSGIVTNVGLISTFTPDSNLAANTTYTAKIVTNVKDLAGNALAVDKTWSFTTGAAADTTPPTITLIDPADGNTGVATNKKIAAAFSEVMDPLTINTTTFTVKQGTTVVEGDVTYVGNVATFTPASDLAGNTTYSVKISTAAKDLANNALAADKTWSFTTGTAPDTTPPTVSSTLPVDLASGEAVNSTVNVTFSELMDPVTITTANFIVDGVTGTVTYDAISQIATFTPTSSLAPNTLYTARITTGVKDLAKNALAAEKIWRFTTVYTWVDSLANPLFGGLTSGLNRAYYPSAVKVGSTYHIWYGDGNTTRHATSASAEFSGISYPAPEITVGGIAISSVFSIPYHPYVLHNVAGWTVNGTTTSDAFLMYISPGFNSVSVLHSADGNDWTNYGTCTGIMNSANQGSVVYNFSVLYEGGTTWKGYADNGGGQIQYYTSTNGLDWNNQATNILGSSFASWESATWACIAPRIILSQGTYYLFYSSGTTGNDKGIGKALSSNGKDFVKAADNPILSVNDGLSWRANRTYAPSIIYDTDHWRMYYTGRSSSGIYSIGTAVKLGGL